MYMNDNIKNIANFNYAKTERPPCIARRASFFLLLDRERGNKDLPERRQSFEHKLLKRVNLVFTRQTGFSIKRHPFIDKHLKLRARLLEKLTVENL